jgi:molybdopterin converting factor small subunit
MNIEIRLFASLASYAQHPAISPDGILTLDEPATIRDAVSCLSLPVDKIKLIFLNGVHASPDASVKNGDRVGLFPPIGGG